MASKKELVAELEAAGDNTIGSKETVAELEARLADAKANGVRHKLTAEDLEANPELAKPAQDGEEPLKAGDEVRLPWPAAAGSAEAGAAEEQMKKDEAAADEKAAAEAAAAKQEAEDAKTVEVEILTSVKHDGVLRAAGDKVKMNGKAARALREAGAAK